MDEATRRRCRDCGETKPAEELAKDSRTGRPATLCKDCKGSRVREWRSIPANTAKWRAYARETRLARGYGLTLSEYEAMLEAQAGVCAICRNACPTGRSLAVDHDHTSGIIRGLLCVTCNQRVGVYELFRKDAEAYLHHYGTGHPALPSGMVVTSIKPPRAPRVGHRRSPLTDEDVIEIRTRYKAGGVTQRALAIEFRISQNQVGRIIRREAWPEVA